MHVVWAERLGLSCNLSAWRRQNSRRFTQADDLRMRPKGQIQHGCAAVAETTDEQQLQALAAHRLWSTRSLRSIVI